MFNLLKSTVDRALQSVDHQFEFRGQVFSVRRHEFAPVTLKVRALSSHEFFEVDLVPSLEFNDLRFNPS